MSDTGYSPAPSFTNQQGSAGSTDLATQLQGIVKQLSANGLKLDTLTAAVNGRTLNSFTVAGLPGTPAIGDMAAVTNGTAALAWGAIVTGGGSTVYLVWWNGANWTVVGK